MSKPDPALEHAAAGVTAAEIDVVDADLHDPGHAAAIVAVLDTYAQDPVGGGAPLRPDVRERLVSVLQNHPGSRVLLAYARPPAASSARPELREPPEPIGIAICFLGLSTFEARPLLNVHDLAVVPAWRGRGTGRRLLEAAEARAQQAGCCKLTLEVQDDNTRARHLYDRFGFSDFRIYGTSATRFLSKPLRPLPEAGGSGTRP